MAPPSGGKCELLRFFFLSAPSYFSLDLFCKANQSSLSFLTSWWCVVGSTITTMKGSNPSWIFFLCSFLYLRVFSDLFSPKNMVRVFVVVGLVLQHLPRSSFLLSIWPTNLSMTIKADQSSYLVELQTKPFFFQFLLYAPPVSQLELSFYPDIYLKKMANLITELFF